MFGRRSVGRARCRTAGAPSSLRLWLVHGAGLYGELTPHGWFSPIPKAMSFACSLVPFKRPALTSEGTRSAAELRLSRHGCGSFGWGFVAEAQFDGAAGEHDQGEGGLGGVEPVGAAGDQSDVIVQSVRPGVVHSEPYGGQDAVAVLADGVGDLDEGGQAGTAGLGAAPVEQPAGLLRVQVAGEDARNASLRPLGPPGVSAAGPQPAQGRGLVVGEVLGSFQQRPAGTLERRGRALVR
jgi:hypothetical protein